MGISKKVAQDEARRCPQCAVATCLSGCPLGIDIPGFIRLLREGDVSLALERIKKENPFPAICGRICPAPCEEACIFHADGNPIPIRTLERFAADFGGSKTPKTPAAARSKKAAVIGSGPAGMSAAYHLAQSNIGVTIFEAAHEPGGLLRYAVPEFRLPQKVIDEQFAQLRALGVDVQTNAVFGRTLMLDEIFMQGFSALLLATGASLPQFSHLPGHNLAGVFYDMEFFHRLQMTRKQVAESQAAARGVITGQTVVLGRGLSAFDAARLSLRLGSRVQLIIEGFEEQAGVSHQMLQESKEEGVEIHSMQPLELVGDDHGFVRGVKCRKLDIVEEKDGLKLLPSSEPPQVIDAGTVVLANGHRPNDFLKQYLPQLRWDKDGSLWADAQTGMTSMDKVFACGSLMTAGGSVVSAMAGGKAAAKKIAQYLGQTS